MKIQDVFTSVIAVDFLNLDNNKIEKFCKEQIFKSRAYTEFNETQSEALDLTDPIVEELVSVVEEKVNYLHKEVGLSPKYRQKVNYAWANLSTSKYTRQPHTHYNCAFSCVYYVKGNADSGPIEIMSPVAAKCQVIYPHHISQYNRFTSDRYWYEPEPGKLLIFPSWLTHYVHPNNSSSERISVAFNTQFLEIDV